jgi:hypothetical protein
VIKSPKLSDIYGGLIKILSQEYDIDYDEVMTIGNTNLPNQMSYEKATAKFWKG